MGLWCLSDQPKLLVNSDTPVCPSHFAGFAHSPAFYSIPLDLAAQVILSESIGRVLGFHPFCPLSHCFKTCRFTLEPTLTFWWISTRGGKLRQTFKHLEDYWYSLPGLCFLNFVGSNTWKYTCKWLVETISNEHTSNGLAQRHPESAASVVEMVLVEVAWPGVFSDHNHPYAQATLQPWGSMRD